MNCLAQSVQKQSVRVQFPPAPGVSRGTGIYSRDGVLEQLTGCSNSRPNLGDTQGSSTV